MSDTGVGFDQLIGALEETRQSLLKHIDGISDSQAIWKPYPGCKSIAETLDHLLWSETVQTELMKSGKQPDYTTAPDSPPAAGYAEIKAKLALAHANLVSYLKSAYAGKPVDTPVSFWGHTIPLWRALIMTIAEDSYHTGQIGFIRMASDPGYDYYAHIYGGE